jgi:hypothetical protein
MDERKIKRLIVILVMAIAVIMLFKFLLTKAVTNLGNAAMQKKHAAVLQTTKPATDVPTNSVSGVEAASSIEDAGVMALSAVPATN